MKILGIDPGLRITGFGVIEIVGQNMRYTASGTIKTKSSSEATKIKFSLADRLKIICDNLQEVVAQYQPNESCVEQVFVNKNPQTTLLLGQARGAIISVLTMHNLLVAEYTALQIKQAVVGNGHAKKEQVQAMVAKLLNLGDCLQSDSADALACAICHAHSRTHPMSQGTRGRRARRKR